MSELLVSIEETIRSRQLLQPNQSLLVGVSGGVDSMVLLHVLAGLAPKFAWRPVVAHFNHRLRGRASNADESFVQETASSLRLEFVSERGDVRRMVRSHRLSLEMAARTLRHEFFVRACSRLGIRTVALAHHADDQVELFFLRLLRGAGGEGLSGMEWAGPSPSNSAIRLVRPLLNVGKEELRAFADRQQIPFHEDATNARLEHQRNRIRHELLPLLRSKYQPGIGKVVARAMEIVRAESDFVTEFASVWMAKSEASTKDVFDELPVAIQRRIVQLNLARLGIAPEFDLIERLRCSVGEIIAVNPKLTVWRDGQGQLGSRPVVEFHFDRKGVALDLTVERGHSAFDGLQIAWQIEPWRGSRPLRIAKEEHSEQFDARKVGSPIFLRHWRPGDRFQPIGMQTAVKVQDLLTNAKIPRARRHELVLAVTAVQEIFWVEGLRISERFKISNGTQSSLKWAWKRPNSAVASPMAAC